MSLRTGPVTTLEDPPLVLAPPGRRFRDRRDAGTRLAALLEHFRDERPVVVGMARGGVPVAAEVARTLEAPLDVVVVRKVGAPQNPEFALGAVAEGGIALVSHETAHSLGLSDTDLKRLIARAEGEVSDRARRYRGEGEPASVANRTVILVDDGLATGRSAGAALQSLRNRGAGHLVLAVPVAAPPSVQSLRGQADEIVCVEMPEDMWAVGLWYEDFSPTSDEEVTALLAELGSGPRSPSDGAISEHELTVTLGADLALAATMTAPADAVGMVVFAHGSGSSRLSPRNRAVAHELNAAGFATFLFDLLTVSEELDRANVFDIDLLASRLVAVTDWLEQGHLDAGQPLGYFGASTGAAAALTAAARLGDRVGAVVSRGGRPDLALDLGAVRAPTLLIVGGEDHQVLELNEAAQRQLLCPSELAIVPGATHLFEEPGALEQVSRLAIGWLTRHLAQQPSTRAGSGGGR